MPYIHTRDGHPIYIRDIGKGAPVVLLHGFGMQSRHWLPFALPLAHKFRFLIPDLRGFGHSHLTDHNRDCVISNYADDLKDIVDHFQLNSFKLAGISMGAFVALQYQKVYGDKQVEGYMHIDQSPRSLNNQDWSWGLFGQHHSTRITKAKTLIRELLPYLVRNTPYHALPDALRKQLWQDLGDFFASALSRPLHKNIARKICANEQLIKQLMPTDNWQTYIRCLQAYLDQDYNMLPVLEKLNTPISLIVGLKSEMYPCGGQLRIADYAKNCEVIPFENSGHTPLIDQPLKFLYELRRFAST